MPFMPVVPSSTKNHTLSEATFKEVESSRKFTNGKNAQKCLNIFLVKSHLGVGLVLDEPEGILGALFFT